MEGSMVVGRKVFTDRKTRSMKERRVSRCEECGVLVGCNDNGGLVRCTVRYAIVGPYG